MARPRGTRPLLVMVFALALGLGTASAGADPAPAGEPGVGGPDGYIVVLERGDPDDVAQEHRQDHAAEIGHVYRHALPGYSARMSEQAAERVAADDRVAYVEVDREVTIAHHQCGHLGGPGGGGEECDVYGAVTDASGGEPVAGAEVVLEEAGQAATTDGDGEYRIEDVEDGAYTLTADLEGYESASEELVVDNGDVEVNVALASEEEPEAGTISGRVTDTGGDGIVDATVQVEGAEDRTTTDTDDKGGYTTEQVEAGEYTVTASQDEHGSDSQTVEVDGDVDGIDFALAEPTHEHDADNVPWGVERTGAAGLHGAHTGDGVSVYILDSGIQADHPDLEPNLGEGHAVVECHKIGRESCEADWDDDHGHGTWVAGTVGATDADRMVGMAPEVTLHAVKVLDRRARSVTSDIIAGVDWVAGQAEDADEAVVANMSLGRSGSKDATCTEEGLVGDGDSYHAAICGATNQGVVFAVAAGNSDADAQGTVPAAYDDTVLTVSATDPDDVFTEFTNWGDEMFDLAEDEEPQSAPVALAAPGQEVLSTWNDGGLHVGEGTSAAAPHVAGGAALVIAAHDIAGDQGRQAFLEVRAALMGQAEDTHGWDDDSSFQDEVDNLDERQEGFLDLRFVE